jgi:hypothetical protein
LAVGGLTRRLPVRFAFFALATTRAARRTARFGAFFFAAFFFAAFFRLTGLRDLGTIVRMAAVARRVTDEAAWTAVLAAPTAVAAAESAAATIASLAASISALPVAGRWGFGVWGMRDLHVCTTGTSQATFGLRRAPSDVTG